MNKARRADLTKALGMIAEAREVIDTALNEELDALDNLPDSLRDGDKGSAMQEKIDAMQNALDELDNTIASIEEAAQ